MNRGNRKAELKLVGIITAFFFFFFIPAIVSADAFTAKTIGDYGNVTVMEVTGNYDAKNPDGTLNSEPRQAIAKEFFRTHKDEYDFVVIFSNFDFQMPDATSKAFYLHVKNNIQGIGRQPFDYSSLFGSNSKLQGIIDIGNISTLVIDPLDPKFEETLSILAHEQMHRWGAYVKFKDSNGNIITSLLGLNLEHWSFLLDSYGSVLYGNKWQDNGNGTFTSIAVEKYYSPLDLYLMGFNDKSQVPPMLLINNTDIDPARSPEVGVTITGTPRYITIDDIITAEGERIPGFADSQKTFKTAFIFVTAPGTFAGNELYGIENIRNGWVTRFSVLTDGKGIMQVVSTVREDIPVNPGPILPPVIPRTLPPNIEDGVMWLMANQRGDGSWMDLFQTTDRDTAEAVFILKNFDISQQSYSLGLQWLNSDESENIDYISRRIETLAHSEQDVSALIALLVSKQNPDGGWGSNKSYISNPMDTSLALSALATAGYADQGVVSAALGYLKLKQNTDGGWGGDDEGSIIEVAADVLISFNKYRNNYQLEEQITNGLAWLTQRQNPDGGFGNSPSTVYDTAIAVLTLRQFNVSPDVTNNGLNYILGLQSENGSWYGSPYQTALAINAVWKATVDPDLSIKREDITFIPPVITSLPTNLVMNVNIWNLGRTEVPQAKVALYDEAIAEANKIGEQVVAFPGQSSVTVTFSVAVNDGNEHRFYISVDPENIVKESNESNNTALKILYPNATYDFEILPSDVSVSPNPADIFQDVKITSKVTNKGTMNAYNVQLKYYIDDPQGAFDIATATVDIPAGATVTNEITWRANKAGENLPVIVFADPFNSFPEISEENNAAVTYLTVNNVEYTDPNLTTSYKDLVITPNPVNAMGSVTISAIVKNEGFSPATNIKVNFYRGVPGQDGILLGTQTVPSLEAGESNTVSIGWDNITESGERIIYIKVDPDNQIQEIREDDNDAFATLKIFSLPDLTVSTNSIVFTPPAPRDGDTVSIYVTVKNNGDQSVSDVLIRAYEGNIIIGSETIPSIAGNNQTIVSFNYDTVGKTGIHQITVVVDPENSIIEQNESNNSASKTFGVQTANQWLTEQYISPNGDGIKDSTQFFFRLDTPHTVKIVVVNNKGETVRTFSGSEFENTTSGTVTWDGLGDNGMVVDDGQYQIKVTDLNNNVLQSLLVTVDNNRSPLTDAIGTKYFMKKDLECNLNGVYLNYLGSSNPISTWLPDDSGIIFTSDNRTLGGVFLMSPDGSTIEKLTPDDWMAGDLGDSIRNLTLSPDGKKAVLVTRKEVGTVSNFDTLTEIWVLDINSKALTRIDYRDYNLDKSRIADGIALMNSENTYVSYVVLNTHGSGSERDLTSELWVSDISGLVKTKLAEYPQFWGANDSLVWHSWSPDGQKIFFADVGKENVWVSDPLGRAQKKVLESGTYGSYNPDYFMWLDDQYVVTFEWTYSGPNVIRFDTISGDKRILGKVYGVYNRSWYETNLNPRWSNTYSISEDKKKIAFLGSDSLGNEGIVISDFEGNFTTFPYSDMSYEGWYQQVAWSPDGRWLAYMYSQHVSDNIPTIVTLGIIDTSSNNKVKEFKVKEGFQSGSCSLCGLERKVLEWFPDNRHIKYSIFNEQYNYYGWDYYDTYSLDVNTERSEKIDYGYVFFPSSFSPRKTYLSGTKVSCGCTDPEPIGSSDNPYSHIQCGYNAETHQWVVASLLNLTAELMPSSTREGIRLFGTAIDLNFEGYKLEYADTNSPDVWHLVVPPSNVPVVNELFTTWVPPYEGTFYVSLTVWDKAGNVTTNRKRVSWGQFSNITNIYKSLEVFSPNGDEIKDTMELHYSVLAPMNLEFDIYDGNDILKRTFYKSYMIPADDFITWDGRDSNGEILPDGKYKIKVLEYEFFVEVDNTPPNVNLAFSAIYRDPETFEICTDLLGYAFDSKIKKWVIEYGEGDNPQEWYELTSGEDILVQTDNNNKPILNPIQDTVIESFADSDIESLVGKKLKITAEDFGGNKSTATTDFLEEKIILLKWNNHPILEIITADLLNPETNYLGGQETIRLPIISLNMQYWRNQKWNDVSPVINPLSGEITLEWDTSDINFQEVGAVRLKSIDILGQEHYSNPFLLESSFIIDISCGSFMAMNSLFEKLKILKLQVQSNQDTEYSQWTDYKVYDSTKEDIVPFGTFEPPLPFVKSGMTYKLRMIGLGTSGKSYESNIMQYPPDCPEFSLNVVYTEADCGNLSEKVLLTTKIITGISNITLKTLSFYIQKPEGLQLLRQFDLAMEGSGSTEIDTSAISEGSYPVKAVLTYLDLSNNKIKERSVTNTLIVDRVLPNAQITYPGESLLLCPNKVTDTQGNWNGIIVEGTATDNTNVNRYELYYGLGEDPDKWLPAMTRKAGKVFPISVNRPVQGQLGIWDITNFEGASFSFKLKVIDVAGNVNCYTTSFSVDANTDITNLFTDKTLFSPNGDGILDDVGISYQIGEYSAVDLKVFQLTKNQDESYIPDPTSIRTIISGHQYFSGTENTSWDGKDDSGAVVPDGLYAITVFAKDLCGNANQEWVPVEVDNTPPTVNITYPGTGEQIGNIVEIKGTVSDLHFQNYFVEAGQGDNPNTWIPVSSGTTPVNNEILGTWNTFGLEGRWTIRLTAEDKVGNKNEAKVTMGDHVVSGNLINSLDTIPKLFSPNNDGKLDITTINYGLTDACDATISIINQAGTILYTYTTTTPSEGTYSFIWDGRDNLDATVIDGVYTIKLSVALSSNPSVTQEEAVTVVVDSTLPTIDIKQPLNNSFLKGDIVINGTIVDNNILEYSINYSSDAGFALVDKANQNRENYTFGILNALPEGNYILNVKARDLGENTTENNISFTVDRTPPQVILDNPKAGEYYGSQKSTIPITGTITEKNLKIYSLRYGPGDNPIQWIELQSGTTIPTDSQLFSWNVGSIVNGIHTISLYAKDKAGSSGEVRVKITIDNTPPEVSIIAPQEGSYVIAPIDIKGTASDANLDKYTLELSEGQCSSAFKWGVIKSATTSVKEGVILSWQILPTDGNYCLRLTATDKIGNKTETKINIRVDIHPPIPPVLSGNIENKSNARLTWTQNTEPDLVGYNLYRDDQKINTSLMAGVNYLDENLKEGIHAYTVTAVDLAGNESKSSNEVKLRIDLTGPDAKIRSPLNGASVSGIVDIKGNAYSYDDFKQYRIYIGQGQNPSAWNLIRTSPVPVSYGTLTQWDTLGINGLYSVKLEAEDLTGNISTHQIVITIDDIPPAPPVLISATPNGSNVTLTWQANTEPDLAGYLLYRNNQLANVSGMVTGDLKPYLISGTTYLDINLPDGKFKYYLIAMDQAGNLSNQSNTIEVNLDTHPPHATIVEPADKSKFDSTLRIRAESTDLDITSIQFQYKRAQDSIWINLNNPITQPPYITYLEPSSIGLTYGNYNLRAVATDKGGKTDPTPSYVTVTYTDITAPSVPFDLQVLTNGKDVTLTWAANAEADLNGYNIYRTSGSSKTKINTAVIKYTTYHDSNLSDGVYTYEVTAVDTLNNESKPSNSASVKIYAPVIAQPYTPTGQKIIEIQGINAAANSLVEIFNEINSVISSAGTVNADSQGDFIFTEMNLNLGENRITAKATDSEGNISRASNMVVVVYNDPPSAPTGLIAVEENDDVNLNWNPNTESDFSGYNLYRNGEKLNTPSALISGNITASSYYYNPPSYAFDSNPSTYWISYYSYETFSPVFWEIDLPSPELINHIEIHWYNESYAGKDYEIQVWSGYAWITQTKVTGNTLKDNTFDFKPSYRTDKIRIYITDTTNTSYYKQVAISEIIILKDKLIAQPSYQNADLHDGNYTYTVTAVDYYGFESLPSEETTAAVGDVTPPSVPLNLTATTSGSDITLNWSPNAEPDLEGYNVYRNTPQGWLKINTSLITTNTYTDGNLLNGTYTYSVTAVDAVGNESLPSNEAVVQVSIAVLQPPFNLHVNPLPEGEALDISWEYPGGSPSGYNLYRSTTSGGPYIKLNTSLMTSTSYLDKGLTNGTTYYYVVVAVDSIGNESSYSNEAMGIPSDTVVPHQPVIFFPTIPENPILLYNDKTDISGIADLASVVELFKDGDSTDRTVALDNDTIQSFAINSNSSDTAISPDGKTLAYTNNQTLWIQTLSTGNTVQIIQKGYAPVWSPDGNKLAYIYTDTNWNDRIAIYDIEKGSGVPVTDDMYVYEQSPSWSFDEGEIAFISNREGSDDIWIKDLGSGSLTRVTYNAYPSRPRLSPDGTKLAYFKYQNLYIVDLFKGDTLTVDDNTDWYSIDWSPDSKKILFKSYANGNGDIFVYDLDNSAKTQVTVSSNGVDYPTWSPDGSNIVLAKYEDDWSRSLWITSSDAKDQRRLLPQNLYNLNYLSWARSGGIVYRDQQDELNIVYLRGYFSFKEIQLDAGENLFYAVSTDASGNVSPSSEEISIVFDTSIMPDLEVTADDIFVYPPYPVEGEEVLINVYVRNKGQAGAQDVEVDVYLMKASGNVELLTSEKIPSMESDSEEVVVLNWDSAGSIGTNTLIAVLDPGNTINEHTESNNLAMKEIPVLNTEGITMTTTLDAENYQANQDVKIHIDIRNSGIEKDMVLTTIIEDENGNTVTSLDPVGIRLNYAESKVIDTWWNTGITYAGSYRVHTVLKDGVNVITESTVPFTILPDINIDSSVVTSKIAYGPNEDVFMTINVKNNGNNYVIPGLDVKVKVMDASNNILFNETKNIINLFPGASNNINSTWNTGILSAGNYTIVVEIYRNDELILSKSVSFMINASSIIKGSITVSPTVVLAGGSVQVGYAVKNTGNTAMNGLSLNLFIIDPETQTIMSTYGEVIDLGINTTRSGGFSFSTQGYALKTYTASLQYVYQGNTKTIATAAFTVKDVTPPVVNIVSPISGNSYSSRFDIVVIAADGASGVNSVEYRIDSGGWKLLPVTDLSSGRYSTSWTPSAEDGGPHTISVRATDKAGNTSAVISVTITVAQSPPTGTIAINNNDLYTNNADVTLTFHATDSSGSAVAKMCISNTTSCTAWEDYTETKAWTLTPGDGTKTVYVWYQDSLGNAGTMPFSDSISLDTTSPGSDIVSPLSGATIMGMTINIKGTAFDNGSLVQKVEVSTDGGATWNSVTSTTSWSYEWTVSADGTYTIKSRATDNAGNVEIPGIGSTVSVYKRQPSNISTSGRQLLVNSNPFTIKGVVYSPVPIGEDPETTPPYGDYFTFNYTGIYDRDLPLLRQMGANALRLWTWDGTADHHDFLDIAYNGGISPIYIIAGYQINPGSDIDPQSPNNVRQQLKADFRAMVAAHKNHPAILMWAIGNDLNGNEMYSENLDNLFSLINEMAAEAHQEEGSNYHPVTAALINSNIIPTVSAYDAAVPSLDVWGVNVYRGNTFGTLFDDFKAVSSKPLAILEYGIDAFDSVNGDEYENIGAPYQAIYAEALWNEIEANSDVCIGGSIMEYSDEWWKGKYSTELGCPDNNPALHSICGYSISTEPDEYTNEEWWGIVRTAYNDSGTDTMETRAVYYTLQELWGASTNEPHISISPNTADFGSIAVGDITPIQLFTFSNAGMDNLAISTITLSGINAFEFIKQNDHCSGHTLVPSKTCTLQVVFSPATAGSKSATLSVPSDDPITPTVYVGLSGTATVSISGAVTDGQSPLSEVIMTLSGAASATTTTDASGNYKFSGLINGGYTVTPNKTGFMFTPTSSSFIISGGDLMDLNFTGAITTFTVTPSAGTGGSISPSSPQTVNYDGTASFTVRPSTGYHIADVVVDGVSQGEISSYTFTNVVANHIISASFEITTGVFGDTGVRISGGGYIDSYNSSNGPYDGSHGANGPVGTNSTAKSAITLSGGAKVYGDVWVGPGGDPNKVIKTSGGAVIYGTKGALSSAKDMTPMADPGGGTPVSFTKGTTLTSGTYRVSSVNLSGNGIGTIDGNVTLYVTGNMSVSGNSKILILPGGSLTVYVSGNINISGGGIVNQALNPHTLIIYGTSTCTTANYSGGSALYGAIYTPKANITISGGSSVYGTVVGSYVMISGGATVHCDESL